MVTRWVAVALSIWLQFLIIAADVSVEVKVNSVATQCVSTSSTATVHGCGPKSLLIVRLEGVLDGLEVATSDDLPVALSGDCVLQSEIEMTVKSSRILAYDEETGLWAIEVNCSFPSTDVNPLLWETEDEDEYDFMCDLTGRITTTSSSPTASNTTTTEEALYVPVDTTLAAFPYFSQNDWAITNFTASTANGVVGIGKNIKLDVVVNGSFASERQKTLHGVCVIHDKNAMVAEGGLTYTVQVNDSDVNGLPYNCELIDGASNTLLQSGILKHNTQQIDGSEPVMDDQIFMLFSTEKPARIGTVISITLRAKGLKRGYTGRCMVNGVVDLPLLAGDDDGFYMTQYTVHPGDNNIENSSPNDTMPFSCLVQNAAGNTYQFEQNVALGFAIDAHAPEIASTSILFASDRPAHEGSIIEIQITLTQDELHAVRVVSNNSCTVNNVSVAHSFTRASANTFLVTYVVGKGEASWKAGELPIHCLIEDSSGNTALIDRFTDGNTLFARELKPVELEPTTILSAEYFPDPHLLLSFVIIAVASHTISKGCPHVGLPRITGYILTGILVGPYVLNFIPVHEIHRLRIFDELSMAYIGLTAGSKLHWREMRPILKSILLVTLGLTVVEYIVGTVTITVLAGFIDFLHDTTESEKYAIALLAGCMMIARSPSSALAVIEETKSQGHFTTLIFAVTVMCDVSVIFLFNVNSMVTESFLSDKQMSSDDLVILVLQLCGSIGVGLVLGKILGVVILYRHRKIKRKSGWLVLHQAAKQCVILVYGWAIFVVSHLVHPYLEPLLCCMVSGAVMWNTSANPEELAILLKRLADVVYVCFFTITGATLELDMLAKALALSIVLCITRMLAIFLGSFLGGMVAGEAPAHSRVAWMAYITQAGVTLGLAKQIQLLYPGWGSYFSTMIVAVVICNQLIGPPLLRYVLRYVGDARKKEIGKVDGDVAVVFTSNKSRGGAEGNASLHQQNSHGSAIARLEMCGWNVFPHEIMVEATMMTMKSGGKYHEHTQEEVVRVLKARKPLDVVVVMMNSNEENLQLIRAVMSACQQLRRLSVLRVVVSVVGNEVNDLSPSTFTDVPLDQQQQQQNWATIFAELPETEEHGDTIDVVVVDRNEATDMLIELAACGKVVNTAVILAQEASTAIAMEEAISEENNNIQNNTPTRPARAARLRQTLTRRMMLV